MRSLKQIHKKSVPILWNPLWPGQIKYSRILNNKQYELCSGFPNHFQRVKNQPVEEISGCPPSGACTCVPSPLPLSPPPCLPPATPSPATGSHYSHVEKRLFLDVAVVCFASWPRLKRLSDHNWFLDINQHFLLCASSWNRSSWPGQARKVISHTW